MKLELFSFIEKTGKLLHDEQSELVQAETTLRNFFTETFGAKDHFVQVRSRIKGIQSLKEKILRHNLYMGYKTPERLLENLSDLIGIRIECRFINDERHIFEEIRNLFRIRRENGFYASYVNDAITLKLSDEQPMRQKNGFEIYKIDGCYQTQTRVYRFELQIKSLVNVFWGDIDHKILYKNYSYMLTEKFLSDIMGSIKENLEMIDRELMLLYNHLHETGMQNAESTKKAVLTLLSKSIHDVYSVKVRKELGFPVDFKHSCDTLVSYLFMRVGEGDEAYVQEFVRIMNRLKFLENTDIDFTEPIYIAAELQYPDIFAKRIGDRMLEVLNKDFGWNLFFRILFDVQQGSHEKVFVELVTYVRRRYQEAVSVALSNRDLMDKEKSEISNWIMEMLAEQFESESDVDFISDRFMYDMHEAVHLSLSDVPDIWDTVQIKENLRETLLRHLPR